MPGFYFINPEVEGYSIAQPFAAAQPKPRARVPICYQTTYNPKQQARLMSVWHRPLIMDPLQATVSHLQEMHPSSQHQPNKRRLLWGAVAGSNNDILFI